MIDQTLSWKESELTQRERTFGVHGLHPSLGKFPPQLPAKLIERYSEPNDIVIDPFVGCGTTMVEANRLGRRGIGIDLAPFSVALSRVKTTLYDLDAVSKEIDDFVTRVWNDDKVREVPEFFQTWYSDSSAQTLLACRDIINSEYHFWRFPFVLIVLVSRVARSARQAPHYELDFPKAPVKEPYWCYKHGKTCQPTANALGFLSRYAKDTVKRLREQDKLMTDRNVNVFQGDMRQPNVLPSHPYVHLCVTSPPYIGGIDYHRQHEYSYELFPDYLPRYDALEIGPAFSGRGKKAQACYVKGIVLSFQNVLKALRPSSFLCIIANDNLNLYDGIREQLGIEEVERMHREVDRRTGLRQASYSETIFVWRKGDS